jgi:Gas vesicle protein K
MTDSPADKLLSAPLDLDPFARDLRRLDDALSRRVDTDPENVERGLAQLVLTVVELLRQLMERQALRRVEAGGLDDETVERLGRTLMLLEERMGELREVFGLREEDLNLDLGPLGRLL